MTTLGKRFVSGGTFLAIERVHFLVDGQHLLRIVVHHPGAVAVVPVIGDDVILIEQERAPLNARLLEIPAGKRDVDGEPVEVTAIRECEEEVGWRPGRLTSIGGIYTTPGFSDERIWLFIGWDLEAVPASPQGHEEEHATVVRMPIADALRRVDKGTIVDAKTVIGLQALRREFES
ncbi:MAG: NUDIX hydrolase [Acidimicrobiia bacterium]